ncbi:L-serine ammonia-lyase, iron-sulfur-dependent, subunit alpha [Anaerococcus sp.]|uniref:L-cysteine desulfidase family protein n=1 Tax=Anaerococcus sp. TaxID=1872515 RepID=UPI00280A9985|nr:L-serine ammonia-lyase, iron-sulfur-dependent, subunit alpha [Anaerococcus sp.]MDU3177145.1 L-serine ammonia-lyase, iron-sulfur-dependent, subunit alpha [Anaerococcus sp.]MDU5534835.1 L-serine ammonia-lyase, iron-sulfur-dependent, subunit alpha [Anaerococcus sp.]
MDKSIENELINIVGEDSTKAIGCTEPVAVAYAANVASSYINNDDISKIILKVSKNIYKNGKAVKIPNTGNHGLDLAASLGAFTNESKKPFLVFSNLTDKEIDKARNFTKANNVDVNYIDNVPDIYIEARLITKDNDVTSIISNSHSHVSKIIKNGEVIIDNPFIKDKKSSFSIKNMTFEQLAAIVRNIDINDIDFVLEGIYVNMDAAQEGLKGYGLNLGKKLNELKENNILPDNFITDTRILTAAAADMRMGGGPLPIMTSGGSGNQGVGIILPIYMVAKQENLDDDTLARGLFFAHIINRYVKEYAGKLSGLCGCAIGAAIGSCAAIAFMLGGGEEEIAGACTNIFANITGMICDGAKESCSMKLSTSAEESIIAAYLALNGVVSQANVGIVGKNIEETIANIGKLSHQGFKTADEVILEIIDK